MITRVSKLRKHLVSLDIGQLNALVVFATKSSTTSESTKELLDDIFAECDRSSLFKNFTDRWYINKIYCRKYKEIKEIYTNQVNQVLNRSFFNVFSENWEWDIETFSIADHTRLLLGF